MDKAMGISLLIVSVPISVIAYIISDSDISVIAILLIVIFCIIMSSVHFGNRSEPEPEKPKRKPKLKK